MITTNTNCREMMLKAKHLKGGIFCHAKHFWQMNNFKRLDSQHKKLKLS